MRWPLNPYRVGGINVAIDANALDKKSDTTRNAMVDRMLELKQNGLIRLIVPDGVRSEVENPNTPQNVKDLFQPQFFTCPTELNATELDFRQRLTKALRGNATSDRHNADANHLAEASKYCSYFITHDCRILKKSGDLQNLLPPSLQVVTLESFLKIFDQFDTGSEV